MHCLYLNDYYLTLSTVDEQNNYICLETINYGDINYLEKTSQALKKSNIKTLSVVLDVMGEEIKHENIPRVSKSDRNRLLERKEKSLFHNSDYIWRKYLKEEESGRKDHIYLLLGIALSPKNKSIIELLIEIKTKVNGIYFMPALQQKIADITHKEQLLILSGEVEKNNTKHTFRQTYFQEKQLKLTRVTSLSGEYDAEICYQLNKEVERTNHFLSSSRHISAEKDLHIIIFTNEDYAKFISEKTNNENIVCSHLPLNILKEKLNIDSRCVHKSLSDLLCHYVINKKLKEHLQPKSLSRQYIIRKNKKNFSYSIASCFTFAIIVSLIFNFLAYNHNKENAKKHIFLTSIEKEKNELEKNILPTPANPKIMEKSVFLYRKIHENSIDPKHVFITISNAYRDFFKIFDLHEMYFYHGKILKKSSAQNEYSDEDFSDDEQDNFMQSIEYPLNVEITLVADDAFSNREVLQSISNLKRALLTSKLITSVSEQARTIDTRPTQLLEETFIARSPLQQQKTRSFTLLLTFHAKGGIHYAKQ